MTIASFGTRTSPNAVSRRQLRVHDLTTERHEPDNHESDHGSALTLLYVEKIWRVHMT
jgi:hypothetical protein